MATTITPFKVDIPDSAIALLKQKLELATWPDELESTEPWKYGAPLNEVKRLAEYWRNHFDWRKAEATLNETFPQFSTSITPEGFKTLDVHFVHQRSPVENAIPLLFVHGWPGSFLEVKKILPMLKGSTNTPAFHVVAPSLPNFGFSSAVQQANFNLEKYAEVCHKLMLQLGYNEYVTQGGDWGFYITRAIGLLYPEHCKASHINMIRANKPQWTKNPILALQHAVMPYTEREKKGFERSEWFAKEGSGYNLEQRTKPQTIGYALADSPVALLSWIYEKLHDWTDNYHWTPDEILTWISIYQFSTAGPAASVRIYYESVHSPGSRIKHRDELSKWIPHVKLGLAHFPQELAVFPRTWGRTLGPVVYDSVNEHGGHFAAWERPEAIVGDLRKMFGKGGPCYKIVKGKSGYEEKMSKL